MLKRKSYQKLLEWKQNPQKKALLVEGARQVGKTFIIREFGKQNYKNYIEINFEKEVVAKQAFSQDLDGKTIIKILSSLGYGPFEQRETLIFFDEIQSCPRARTAIKFLVEDGQFDIIESGSLLGINYKDVPSYPVGYESRLKMYPLDFEEFLWAKNVGADAIELLMECYREYKPVPQVVHEATMRHYRDYMIVGGMPAAVNAFLGNYDFAKTIEVQNEILASYREDIAKYAAHAKIAVKKMFDAVPRQLNKPSKRFVLSDIKKGATAEKFAAACDWMIEAGTVYACPNVAALENDLVANERSSLYKLYLFDTGLLCAQGLKGIQGAILNDQLEINEGSITENAVAAALAKKGIPLHYYDKKSRLELDFVYAELEGLTVIEVKSGKDYKRHISLDQAEENARAKLHRRIVLSKYNVEVGSTGIIYLPLYMSLFL